MKLNQKAFLANTTAMAQNSAFALAFHRGLGESLSASSSVPLNKYVDAESVAEFAASVYAKPSFAIVGNGVAHNELNKWVNEFFTDVPSQPAYKLESQQSKYFGGEERISHGSGNSLVIAFPGSSSPTSSNYKPEAAVLASLLGGPSSIKWSAGSSRLLQATSNAPGLKIETKSDIFSDAGLLSDISMLFTYIYTIYFILLTTFPQSRCQQPPPVLDFSVCLEQPYNCGNLYNIYYPFWGHDRPSHCGGGDSFRLTCHEDHTTIKFGSQNFTVLEIPHHDYTMKMVRTDLAQDVCSPQFAYTYLIPMIPSQFRYTDSVYNITIFYNCSSGGFPSEDSFMCEHHQNVIGIVGGEDELLNKHPELRQCGQQHIQVSTVFPPDFNVDKGLNLQQVLENGFQVKYTIPLECMRCDQSGGVCGTNDTSPNQFSCYCPSGSHGLDCFHHKIAEWNWKRKCIMGAAAAMIGFLIGITIFCFKRKSSISQGNFWLTTKSNQDIEAFLKNQGAQTLKRYKFSDVKKMTNSFKVKLGQGGFGTVYEGKLLTGCLVAVKVLNPSKGNNEDFINEVASISRTSHVNVVTLLGFCLEGRKKALIYEFMPNGSLDKFIYRKDANFHPLSWDILYQISIGIARGLEYLHKGCNTRILHFDIKPHNILLDENFCPKISDFGLAKLCPEKQSIISMSDARGTMGYVAPEVWNRHFGGVSHKSDVYSYGMMLLEMVGGRKNINAEASHTSEIYFPHWVYKRLEEDIDLRQNEVMSSKENEISKKMIMVGLWCIQTIPNDRPTMRRVIDMLEGNTNSLEMPPKPFLSSPTRSVAESSTSLN